jgi:endo-1,4-beta-D-glucanase Y
MTYCSRGFAISPVPSAIVFAVVFALLATALATGCTTAGHSGNGGNGGSGSGTGGTTGSNGSGGGAVTGGGGTRTTGSGGVTGGGGVTGSGGVTGGGGAATCANAAVSATAAAQLSAAYQSWKSAMIMDCPANSSAVVLKDGSSVVSEGIGYGMLLAVANNDQPLFDKLWKFYSDHLDPQGLMNWAMDACAAPGNNNANSATDGDLDAAMALVQADAAWGGYTAAAKTLIGKIKTSETDSCNGLNVLRPGDKFGGCSDPNNMGKVNPSYFAPGYYRVFALVDTANAAFWTKLAADSYTLLAQYQATMGGLVPEWGFVNGTTDGSPYGYNACRTPWRVAVDFLWFCTPEARTFLQGISSYVDAHGGVAGVPFDKNSAFIGAFALSAMPLGQSKLDAYVASWLGAQLSDTPYFQATLRRLYLHAAAGQFALPAVKSTP